MLESTDQIKQFLQCNRPVDETHAEDDCGAAHQGESAAKHSLIKMLASSSGQLSKSDPLELAAGHELFAGKYRLLRNLGSGGMSTVYLANHIRLERQVAIKVLHANSHDDFIRLERFLRECRAVGRLEHPNVVKVHDFDSTGGIHYLVMEYVDGHNLKEIIDRDGVVPGEQAANFTAQAARGLGHVHAGGIIHRDIKPANLLVDQSGTLKVVDLGVALLSDHSDEISLTVDRGENLVLGTVDYLSPEQAIDSHSVDERADIYSLGCTLYHLLTGQPPFPNGTYAQRLLFHQLKTPEPICNRQPNVAPELVDICNRMMAKTPADRFQTACDVHEALTQWLESLRAPAPAAPPQNVEPQRPAKEAGERERVGPGVERATDDDTILTVEKSSIADMQEDGLVLTLRVLLAYMHGSLSGSARAAVEKKVEQSAAALNLRRRIEKLRSNPALMSPPVMGPGTLINANTVAEYLDSHLRGSEQPSFESAVLRLSTYLDELAACHEILCDALAGKKVRVDRGLRKRLYEIGSLDPPIVDSEDE